MTEKKQLLCFGAGYSVRCLAKKLIQQGWAVTGTCRSDEKADFLKSIGVTPILFDQGQSPSELVEALGKATHVLSSVPPDSEGDTVLASFTNDLATRAKDLKWVGYLSSTGVYGNHDGAWVDEKSETKTVTERGTKRLKAESQWLNLFKESSMPVHIFRISGIYGPERNPLIAAKNGKAQRIFKEGSIFSRVHVEDIAGAIEASINKPHAGEIYNLADDQPAPYHEVVEYACQLMQVPLPPMISFETANMHPMQKSFYEESRKVSNSKLKDSLGYVFKYPDYQIGLSEILLTI